jgi:hypothetical protein
MRISPAIVVPFCWPPNFLSSTFLWGQKLRLFVVFAGSWQFLQVLEDRPKCANLYYFCEFPTTFGSAEAIFRICFVCLS